MEVRKKNKTLYHIQNLNYCANASFDMFVWADHEPNSADIKTLVLKEFKDSDMDDATLQEVVRGFIEDSEVHEVWAEEV